MAIRFVVCIDKSSLGDLSGDDLVVGHVYEAMGEEEHGMFRIVDQSGEDYLYPTSCFESVSLSDSAAHRLHDALAHAA
jgi:hypothetical protein